MKQPYLYLAGVLALLVGASWAAHSCSSDAVQRWQARADTAVARADSLMLVAAVREQIAVEATLRADSLANIVARRDTVVRERIRIVRDTVPVPDTCHTVVAGRDSLINDLLATADTAALAYAGQKQAFAQLQLALRDTRIAVDSLTSVLTSYPEPLPWFVPSLEVGAFAGICLEGPCVGVGVGVTWEIPLPFIGGR